ncbi:GerW family sporulation protein [Maribacter sp. CXY002]|uniref:GerW family sporulation protein n=1 Tax=Maribacter luteocoastalis TaxID=3407671 RepID=UPI003B66D014
MELHFEELLDKVTEFIKTEASTETVIGNQFELGEFKCVPVIKVGMGFGSGGGEGMEPKKGKGQGGGTAAGVGIAPIGFLVTRGEEISFLSATKANGLSAVFEKVPDLIERFAKAKGMEKV